MPVDHKHPLPVIYLAAGRGSRLGATTADRPKAMVEAAGRPLIERSLKYLGDAGFTRFIAVTGHAAGKFEAFDVETVFNPKWDSENNITSTWVARDAVADGCVIVNCDLLFEPKLAQILAAAEGTAILVDDELAVDEESMKATVDAGDHLVRLHKSVPLDQAVGEYIGLTRIDPADGLRFAEILDEFVEAGNVQVYYEDAIEALAAERPVRVERVGGTRWVEIDDHDDLARANEEIGPQINAIASNEEVAANR
ncbi:MAG: NTP transferase domain-containing protein [Solirubrobacterales bacterium]